jgi:hypothetical protein
MSKERRIILGSDQAFKQAKQELKARWEAREGECWEVIFKPYKKDRTLAQNNFYWGVVVPPIAAHCGYTPAETHTVLLGEIFGWKTVTDTKGNQHEMPNRRTTDPGKMSKEDFTNYIHQCQTIAASLGVYIETNWSAAA